MSKKFLSPILALCLLLTLGAAAQELAKRLSNQDIIDMVSLGLSDDVIIAKIRADQDPKFDTSTEGLKALKAAKVSDAVIRAMINPKASNGAGEFLGTGISGGERHPLGPGDVAHIPATIPHSFLVPTGKHITYVLVKFPAK